MTREVFLGTYEEYANATPEGSWELLDGVLYRYGEPATPEVLAEAWAASYPGPSPGIDHQVAKGRLFAQLDAWASDPARAPEAPRILLGPVDVVLAADLVLQPDIALVALQNPGEFGTTSFTGVPDLIVEVASPKTARLDAGTKREAYARAGVPEVWLVWPQEQRVDVFELDAAGEGTAYGAPRSFGPDEPLTTALLPGFSLDDARLFWPRSAPA